MKFHVKLRRTVVKEYIEKVPDGRPKDIPITVVYPGKEPLRFKAYFLGWTEDIKVMQSQSLLIA